MALAESLVCRVENTRWPVKADCIAISAVSVSLISPTRITSGSCLTIDLSPDAKVRSILGLTCTWPIPLILYSIGSSMVIILISVLLIEERAA